MEPRDVDCCPQGVRTPHYVSMPTARSLPRRPARSDTPQQMVQLLRVSTFICSYSTHNSPFIATISPETWRKWNSVLPRDVLLKPKLLGLVVAQNSSATAMTITYSPCSRKEWCEYSCTLHIWIRLTRSKHRCVHSSSSLAGRASRQDSRRCATPQRLVRIRC